MKQTWKSAAKFMLCMLPFAIVAGLTTAYYTLGTGIAGEALAMVPLEAFVLIVTVQTVIYACISALFGYVLADKTGLLKSFRFTKKDLLIGLGLGAACGALFFLLDYVVFAGAIPQVAEFYKTYQFSVAYLGSEIFYGGVVEELMMRLLLMTLFVLLLWKLFARKAPKELIPAWIFVLANIIVALLFALGHLPATLVMFGEIDLLILVRCLLLNGCFGLVFGWLYRKKGLQYAMVAHAMTHICCDALLLLAVSL